MATGHENENTSVWKKKGPVTAVGALGLGLLGSTLYDALLKPGFGVFTEKLTNFLTFGSQKLVDAPYASAAYDPTALPSLVLFLVATQLACFVLIVSSAKAAFSYFPARDKSKSQSSLKLYVSKYFSENRKKRKLLLVILSVLNIVAIMMIFTSFNKAIIIWRVFQHDLKVISPYIDNQKEEELIAMFSSVKTKSDYLFIQKKMTDTATENGVSFSISF